MHGSILLSPEKEKAYRLLQWCLCVPRLAPDSPRLAYYASRWGVPGKIARAIEDGSFYEITADCPAIDLRHLPAAIDALAECERYATIHAHTASESLSTPAKTRLHA